MSIGTQEPEVDATVVDVEAEEKEQKSRDEAIAKVEKIIGGESKAPAKAEEEEKQPDGEEKPAVEVAEEEPVEIPQAIKNLAKEAGLTESLAERLHQSGLLEEALATFDRSLIEHAAKRQPEKKVDETPKKADPPPKVEVDVEVKRDGTAPPPISLKNYDEDLVERDAYFETRIAELTEKLERLSSIAEDFDRQRDSQFQDWFYKTATGLNKDLFWEEKPTEGSAVHKNLEILLQGYEGICNARGLNPYDCLAEVAQRAYPAMFQTEVFKAAQRETVKRLRDAEGKFIEPTRRSGGMPKSEKHLSPEEARAEDLAKVEAILKKSKT